MMSLALQTVVLRRHDATFFEKRSFCVDEMLPLIWRGDPSRQPQPQPAPQPREPGDGPVPVRVWIPRTAFCAPGFSGSLASAFRALALAPALALIGWTRAHCVPRSWLFWLPGFRVPRSGSGSGSHWLDPGRQISARALALALALTMAPAALTLTMALALALALALAVTLALPLALALALAPALAIICRDA
jgi:hypothetical protein